MRHASGLMLGLLLAAVRVGAQGALSTQGFGYPSGGLSTRAAATGAGFAEFDALSTRNPASLLGWGRGGLYFQYDPEFRSLKSATSSDNTVTARFPLVHAGIPIGQRVVLSLSATTLLDRTWATVLRSFQRLGPDSVTYEERVQSTGGLADLRLAVGYAFSSRFAVGAGVHALGGESRLGLVRTFDDSTKYGTLRRSLVLGFRGAGLSAGAVVRPVKNVALALSLGHGGALEMRSSDTVLARGNGPNRMGGGVRFDGINGVSLAASVEKVQWSRLGGLGSAQLGAHDGTDVGVGADLSGPKMRTAPVMVHLGVRQRDLPFASVLGTTKERQFAIGSTIPVGGPRAMIDVAVVRASRGNIGGVSERAWIVSFGFSVRP